MKFIKMSTWKTKLRRKAAAKKRLAGITNSRRLLSLTRLGFLGAIFLILGLIVVIPLFAISLPSPDKVVRREGFSTKILDRNGESLYDIYEDERRTAVSLEDIPLALRQATVAIEDKNFYEHQGFDIFGMLRGISRVFTRGYAQGGSTLTQQLVKNVLLSSERTVFRKIREFILAVQIERRYSKDEILQMYLNESPYGGTAWGVESASEIYWGESVAELGLVESAVLAGLPQRPSVYSPYSTTPEAYKSRTKDVLRRMKEDDYITKEEEDEALENLESLEFQEKGTSFKAPHFVQYVQGILEERYGESVVEQGGLRVTTTLDLELQGAAQEIVAEEISDVEYLHITNGASIVVDSQTGEILAMVGSKNFSDPDYDGQVNVTIALRQPGSAIKPITYVTGLKEGYTASTLIMDVPTEFPGGVGQPTYKPENYDGEYRGPMQFRYTLGNSINVAAVKMLAMVGIKDTLRTAYDLGIESLEPTNEMMKRVGLSLTLGGGEVRLLELTSAYGAFMNGGYKVEPVAILKVEDGDGKILEEIKPEKKKRVLDAGEAFVITDILSDNGARQEVFGPNSLLNIPGRAIAVKTGTTNDKRDNWTVGGDPNLVVGVWVGNNDNSPMTKVASGVSGASPIWRRILLEALRGKPNTAFEKPDSVIQMGVDKVSGYRDHDGFPARQEYFIRGTEPGEDTVHVKLKVCKNDGKLATPGDIASGNYEEKEYFVFKEEDPTAGPGEENLWQKSILNWTSDIGDERYHPPNEYCGSTNPISIGFIDPANETSDLEGSFGVRIRVDSTNNIELVTLYANDKKVRSFTSPPFETDVELDKGTYTLKAKSRDSGGNEREAEVKIGVEVAWDYIPPTPTPTASPVPSPSPTEKD